MSKKRPITLTCSVCGESCSQNTSLICRENHVTCYTCVEGVVPEWCSATGQISSAFHVNGNYTAAGDCPCPRFSSGQCTDGALSPFEVSRALNRDTYEIYRVTMDRIAAEKALKDTQAREEAERRNREQASALVRAYENVLQAMQDGQGVHCPKCHLHGRKDDACIHMTCSGCKTKFCYWCGKQHETCRCDQGGSYIEQRAGWGNYAREGETAATGALLEFHRRKIAVAVRTVKDGLSAEIWHQLQEKHPDLLKNVLPNGRSLEWTEIDTAVMPVTTEDWRPRPNTPVWHVNVMERQDPVAAILFHANDGPGPCVRVSDIPDVPVAFRGKVGRVFTTVFSRSITFHEFYPEITNVFIARPEWYFEISSEAAWNEVTPNPPPPLPEGLVAGRVAYLSRQRLGRREGAWGLLATNWHRESSIVRIVGTGPPGVVRVQLLWDDDFTRAIPRRPCGEQFGVSTDCLQPYPIDMEHLIGTLFRTTSRIYVVTQAIGSFRGRFIHHSTPSVESGSWWWVRPPAQIAAMHVPLSEAFPVNSSVRLMPRSVPKCPAGTQRKPNVSAYQGKVGRVVGHVDGLVQVDFSPNHPELTVVYLWSPTALILHQTAVGGFAFGSLVRVCADVKQFQKLCKNHGGFNLDLLPIVGQQGKVVGLHASGDPLIEFTNPQVTRRLNPQALSYDA